MHDEEPTEAPEVELISEMLPPVVIPPGCSCLPDNGGCIKEDSDGEEYLEFSAYGEVYSFEPNFGTSVCKAWFEGLEPYCNHRESEPWYCTHQWCYVDPATC